MVYDNSPKVYDELEEITGYSRKALKDFRSVASKIDSSSRAEDVSFKHHEIVAPLPPEQQKEFLQKASEENLTTRELREEVQQFKNQNNEMTETEEPQKKVQVSDNSKQTSKLKKKRVAENSADLVNW